jgi:hypothetical protein
MSLEHDVNGIIKDLKDQPKLQRIDEVKDRKTITIEELKKLKECGGKKRKIKERNFGTKEEFIEYLRNTLIPDLRAAGNEATAEDFEEAIEWMTGMDESNISESPRSEGEDDPGEKINDIAREALRDLAYIRDHDTEVGSKECDAVIKKVQQIKKLIYK